jgi:hypothetical protein
MSSDVLRREFFIRDTHPLGWGPTEQWSLVFDRRNGEVFVEHSLPESESDGSSPSLAKRHELNDFLKHGETAEHLKRVLTRLYLIDWN